MPDLLQADDAIAILVSELTSLTPSDPDFVTKSP